LDVWSQRHITARQLRLCSLSPVARQWGGLECEKAGEKNDRAFSVCKIASSAHNLNFKWVLQADREVR
jgi:hypothetical protein